ncbi:MAG: hypothetical protein E6Q50_12180 [Lysobacter sp.]|nr:MAG: hypothetical protein E6Q50_12180 [Lysobacter sp.]
MIVVEIKPSRLQLLFLLGLHLAAAFSFLFGLDLGLAAVGLLAAALGWSLYRSIVVSRRRLPRALVLGDDGSVCLHLPGEGEVEAVPDGTSVVLPRVLWLAWRDRRGGPRRGVLLLVEDQLAPPDWRRLQVWARLRVRPAVEGRGRVGAG